MLVVTVLTYQYAQAGTRRDELNGQLATIQATVDKLNADYGTGGDPLASPPAFPANPPNLDLASVVLSSAAASGVNTGPLTVASQGSEKLGNDTYRSMTMNLTVTGTLPQLLGFFDRVERGGIHTLAFDNMKLDPTPDGRWTAQIQLIVYAQSG